MNRQRSNPPTPMMMYSRGAPQQSGASHMGYGAGGQQAGGARNSQGFHGQQPPNQGGYVFNQVFVNKDIKRERVE